MGNVDVEFNILTTQSDANLIQTLEFYIETDLITTIDENIDGPIADSTTTLLSSDGYSEDFHILTVIATDRVGNTNTQQVDDVFFDMASPVVVVDPTVTDCDSGGTAGLHLTNTDSGSGIANLNINGTDLGAIEGEHTENLPGVGCTGLSCSFTIPVTITSTDNVERSTVVSGSISGFCSIACGCGDFVQDP